MQTCGNALVLHDQKLGMCKRDLQRHSSA